MSQLFISYARENRDTAERVASALGALGVEVWWDRELPGGSEFSEVIEQQLGEARVVIVLWSELSVRSSFVRDESMRALEAGKLLPVRIEPVVPPLGFGQIHALDLLDWSGAADDPAFIDVANEVRKRLGQPTAPRPALRLPRPRWQRQAVIASSAMLLVALVSVFGWNAWNASESRRNLGLGLEEHFGPEPNLQAARNHYLDALEHLPSNARARYYLGHVYAQLGEPELARAAFERAVRDREGLDDAQFADATARVNSLAPAKEPTAVARATEALPPTPVEPQKGIEPLPKPGATGPRPSVQPPTTVTTATAAPLPVARIPRLPPAADVRSRAAGLVEKMFSDDSEARIEATTSLVIDPDLISDAVPLAVGAALERLDASHGKLTTALQSGVVNTLVLLQQASPATLLVNRADIERLLKRASPTGKFTAAQAEKVQAQINAAADQRPVAFIQIANEAQRPIAEALAVRLRAAGYDAPGIELVAGRSPSRSEVRVQGKSERGFARWLAKVVRDADGETVPVQTLRNAKPATDTFEIWFDRDLCTAQRTVPQCAQ